MIKNLLKKFTVPILDSRPFSSLARQLFKPGIPIFMIHRMSSDGQSSTGTTPDHLRRCLTYLKDKKYNFISLEELILAFNNKTYPPDNTVIFTMDDGYEDQARIAAPIFLEFGCPITFFVIVDMLDQSLWPWDAKVSWIVSQSKKKSLSVNLEGEFIKLPLRNPLEKRVARNKLRNIIKELETSQIPAILAKLAASAAVDWPSETPAEFKPMNWDMARKLEADGIRFAPHSRTHNILSKVDQSMIEDEIIGSWKILQHELKNPLKVFCYPTGRTLDFGPREIGILEREHFLGAASTLPGYVKYPLSDPRNIYQLPRFDLPDNMIDFIQYSSWIEQAKRHARLKHL